MRASVGLLCILAKVHTCGAEDPSWIEKLKADGYSVKKGQWDYFTTVTCAHSDTCYALNPATPYGLMYLPPHADETSAGNYTNTGCTHGLCREINGETYSPAWRVAPGEAILLVGRTPPECTYWSFAPSIYSRFYEPGWKPSPSGISHKISACPKVPEDSAGNRCEIFASINDALNFQTVNVSGNSPFNASFAMIMSWDREAEAEVAKQLEESGTGPVNYLRFPGAITKLGVTEGNEDEFISILRTEDFASQAASREFYGNLDWFQLYRVSRPLNQPPADSSFHASFDGKMRTRWTGIHEAAPNATNEQLRDGLDQLKDIIIKENKRYLGYEVRNFQSFVNDSGYECISEGIRCQGDCRDTVYPKATMLVDETICNMSHLPCRPFRHATLTDSKHDSFVVLGVNHRMTNQSLYASVTAYNYPRLAAGILHPSGGDPIYTVMDTDYQGSAKKFLPDHPASPYLYAMRFARNCKSDDTLLCMEVPSKTDDPTLSVITESQPFVYLERMYIHPGTSSGPAVAETILPLLIHFNSLVDEEILV